MRWEKGGGEESCEGLQLHEWKHGTFPEEGCACGLQAGLSDVTLHAEVEVGCTNFQGRCPNEHLKTLALVTLEVLC